MHIILGILAVLGAIAYFIIRANQVNQASREILETAVDAKALMRSSRWRRKAKTDPVRSVSDPRLAASAMMCAMAQSEGGLTERQQAEILALITRHFQLDGQAAEEMFAQGRWLASDVKELSSFLHRLAPVIADHCAEQERRELAEMLRTVAAVEGAPSDIQEDAIRNLQYRLGQ
jgi:uncharacterized tellurite resistance protein B-like protein